MLLVSLLYFCKDSTFIKDYIDIKLYILCILVSKKKEMVKNIFRDIYVVKLYYNDGILFMVIYADDMIIFCYLHLYE